MRRNIHSIDFAHRRVFTQPRPKLTCSELLLDRSAAALSSMVTTISARPLPRDVYRGEEAERIASRTALDEAPPYGSQLPLPGSPDVWTGQRGRHASVGLRRRKESLARIPRVRGDADQLLVASEN
jgi:hypothetical protein